MAGFSNVISDESIVYGDNVSFDGTERGGKVTTNGQLLIGATTSPHIRVNTLTAGTGITITNGQGTIEIDAAGTVPLNFGTDSGTAIPAANTINIVGGTGIDTSGAGSTVTVTFDVTEVPTIPTSIITDDGTLTPAANSFSLLGRSGSKVGASGAILTVRSPPYANQGGSTTVTLNSGSFATAGVTLTTPATAGLLDGDLLEFVATNGVLVIQLAATQVAHLGTLVTSAAGTVTSTSTGDAVCLRYQASTNDWWATSIVGTWLIA